MIGGKTGRHLSTLGNGAVAGDQNIDVSGSLTQPVECRLIGAHLIRAMRVEEREQGVDSVRRLTGREGGGATGVPAVVADDVSSAGSEALAQLAVPPVHRCFGSADEQQGWGGRVAEGLSAELNAVHREDLLVVGISGGHASTVDQASSS